MGYRILLIDDEDDILEFVKYNLSRDGYEVFTASNGAEGLDAALRVKPHLILLDMMMPVLDGIETCKALRRSPALKNVMIVGGGKIGYYLADALSQKKYTVKLIEENPAKAEDLADSLPKVIVSCGNGTQHDLLIEEGIEAMDAFVALIEYFLESGGQAIQVNVLDSETLKEAQLNPEKYSTLQVRVCGWNSYFTNLTKQEQDVFIKTAECLC
jgi:YesN/AraC family two-component response regulator